MERDSTSMPYSALRYRSGGTLTRFVTPPNTLPNRTARFERDHCDGAKSYL